MAGTTTTGGMPPPMAPGGTTGQVLTKKTDASYDTEWTTVTSGGGTVTDVTASAPLSSTGGATPDISIGGGTAGQVLTSNGASAPTFEDLPAPPTVPSASSSNGASIGTAAPGVSADYARADHVHDGSLSDLDDVSATVPTAGQVLAWGGAEWAPATPAAVPAASSSTPAGLGTAAVGVSTAYARADHVHAGTVTALTDRYEELPSQSFSEFAHASAIAASPTRDIQTAIDATPVGPACQVIVGPGSYAGATVTIPSGRNNIAIIGPTPQDFGGTLVSLSSGRAFTIGNNTVRARLVGLQIEGVTTIDTTGAGVHRIERCQLVGGLTVGAISGTIYVVGCEVGSVSVNAGFTGLLLFDRCLFTGTYTNGTLPTRVLMSDCAGLAAAPTTSAILNGRFQVASGLTTFYANGTALLGAPLTAINSLTPAADRIAYYTSASAASMTAITAFGRSLIDDVDAAAARTTLGLGTAATQNSTAFQAADATLTALAGVTTAANKLAYFTGVDTAAATDITTAGREILSTATSGTNGQVLTSSGGGAPTWTTVSGGGGTIGGTIAANEVAFGTGADTIGGSANLEWNNATSVLSIVGDASDCLTVASLIDGQFLAVSPTMYTLVINDPLTPTSSATMGPGDVAVGDGSASGNVQAGLVGVTENTTGNRLTLTAPAGLGTITSEDSATNIPAPLNVVCDELQVNGSAGTSGYVLTSNGTGAAPTWQAAGGGGSPYTPDAWDISWETADGAPSANGWTVTAGSETAATVDTVACYEFTPTTVSSYIQRDDAAALNANFEFRVWVRMPAEGGLVSGDYNIISYYTGATLNKTISVVLNNTGLSLNVTSSTLTAFTIPAGTLDQQWVAITIRVIMPGTATVGAVHAWAGEIYLGSVPTANISQATQAPNGRIRIGQAENGAGTNPAWQIAFFGFRSGFNQAPPSYTYRGEGYGSYGPA